MRGFGSQEASQLTLVDFRVEVEIGMAVTRIDDHVTSQLHNTQEKQTSKGALLGAPHTYHTIVTNSTPEIWQIPDMRRSAMSKTILAESSGIKAAHRTPKFWGGSLKSEYSLVSFIPPSRGILRLMRHIALEYVSLLLAYPDDFTEHHGEIVRITTLIACFFVLRSYYEWHPLDWKHV